MSFETSLYYSNESKRCCLNIRINPKKNSVTNLVAGFALESRLNLPIKYVSIERLHDTFFFRSTLFC